MVKNTLQKGSSRFIIFRENNEWYGVSLELGIVVTEETPEAIYASLLQALSGYLDSLKEGSLRPGKADLLLNKEADPEYEKLWNLFQEKKKIPSPIQISSVGTLAIV